ncbi:MASE1 domain-containing protein [Streptomyces axinellae]|uniref:MASE1 domain-containing protein n=1 Tax=Streptomyces axinellae TaxID=552788 RepID=A0ABN3QGV6_9ACTN
MARTEKPTSERPSPLGRAAVHWLRVLLIAGCYYAGGRLGLLWHVRVEGAVVTPFWPPTGIALSFLLYFGPRVWPGVALGALLVVCGMGPVSYATVGFVVGNTLSPLIAFVLLYRARFRIELDRLRDAVSLVFLGAFLGMLTSATFGTLMTVVNDNIAWAEFWPVWSAWWAGDAVGVLVITPLLLALRKLRRPSGIQRPAEAAVLVAATVGLAIVATRSPVNLLFLVFPLLVWASLRFQLAGSALCTAIVSITATWAATESTGAFEHHSLIEGMISLQALNGSVALTGLLLAAVTAEKHNTQRKIEQACEELAEMVDQLAPQGRGRRSFPAGGRTGQREP